MNSGTCAGGEDFTRNFNAGKGKSHPEVPIVIERTTTAMLT